MSKRCVQDLIKTTAKALPQIYCYSTPGISYHDGWVKIGYTERDVDERIWEQTHTANIRTTNEWQGDAVFEDGERTPFTDKPFHAYLRKQGILNGGDEGAKNEWFQTDGEESHGHFNDFRKNRGILKNLGVVSYRLRDEQEDAVRRTLAYWEEHGGGEFLWNAKPRFGKTLGVYDFFKRAGVSKVLIVTNRPSIANLWYDDYEKFMGTESGFAFVSETDALKGKRLCLSRKQYVDYKINDLPASIEFVSLQDLKGSVHLGGVYDKLSEVVELEWDVLVVDEAHEGVDTLRMDVALENIRRKFTLHLSGTPFKALANGKFESAAIYNWTYADEQKAKEGWDASKGENPYGNLPRLAMLTYRMSDIVREKAEGGIEIDGKTYDYAFDLNEFFATDEKSGDFVYDKDVDAFLDALTREEMFPFSTEKLRDELKHTFWLLERVASAKALKKKLEAHPVFKEYMVVLAAGDGKVDEDDERIAKRSFDAVRAAIGKSEKTITLSVGQLTTGVTVPEWTWVLILSNMKSAALYMQAAFRAQNPCLFCGEGEFRRKETAYVFDFDPARTLKLYDEFANDLIGETAGGRGDSEGRGRNVRELLNFLPVYGEDEAGEMIDLDAERVLSIPHAIYAREVVRHGFMSNFLFENVSGLFRAESKVREILNRIVPVEKSDLAVDFGEDVADELRLDENGEVRLDPEEVGGIADGLFGEKIYEKVVVDLGEVIDQSDEEDGESDEGRIEKTIEAVKDAFQVEIRDTMFGVAKERYGESLTPVIERKIERETSKTVEQEMEKIAIEAKSETRKVEIATQKKMAACTTEEEKKVVESEAKKAKEEILEKSKEKIQERVEKLTKEVGEAIVASVETSTREKEHNAKEDEMRNHLRGFARTIPAFLMAYGSEHTTLATFEKDIPEEVFKEVTSITREEFVCLRDEGKVFNVVVFNDSVKEFLRKKAELANFFDEGMTECIFDYIPPQKTNQIFTPKKVVREMVDLYEKENPGCFDDPDLTFADLYVKSGLFLAEIVKRLFRSEKMKEAYPDEMERLRHIFEKQVYGYAPSEIILRIVEEFLLGFDVEKRIQRHNLEVRRVV